MFFTYISGWSVPIGLTQVGVCFMGEFTDKLKGAANQVAGDAKQNSADPAVRDEGKAQELKGDGQELKGKVKGVINKL